MRITIPSLVAVVLFSSAALAQAPEPPPPAAPPQAAPQAPANAQPGAPQGAADPAKGEPKKPVVAATGYGYKDPVAKKGGGGGGAVATIRRRPGAPIATLPGFEMLPDGGSRLFVDLSDTVQVDEQKAEGHTTYVLRGATLTHRNNMNALMTVHFNTPVWRARLVPSGNDLLFVVDFRDKAAQGALKMNKSTSGATRMTVDFPKGEFLPRGGTPDVTPKDKPTDA